MDLYARTAAHTIVTNQQGPPVDGGGGPRIPELDRIVVKRGANDVEVCRADFCGVVGTAHRRNGRRHRRQRR
jgi:hypothetical protein